MTPFQKIALDLAKADEDGVYAPENRGERITFEELEREGYVERLGHNVFRLTEKGRQDASVL